MTKKEYSNGEVTITWEPDKCIHSKNCVTGLPGVFNFEKRPWIDQNGATTEAIVNQINKCPSGALGYYYNNKVEEISSANSEQIVEVIPNGPLMVYGNIEVKFKDGKTEKKFKVTAFCRCGASGNKPFCDGSHKKIGFEG
jgi:uncharacterized Fe-S cluster protein YjdI